MRATATTTVKAPVDHVWAILSDHEGMSAWAPGLKASLTKPGLGDRNGVGAVRRLKLGPTPAIIEEITAFEPGKRLSYKALSGVPLKSYSGDVELTAVAGGTEIAYTINADLRVPLIEQLAVKAVGRTLLGALTRRVKATA